MKKTLMWVGLVIVILLGGCGAMIGGCAVLVSNSSSDTPEKINSSKSKEGKKEPTIYLGETFKHGELEYTVTKKEVSKTIGDSNEFIQDTAKGMFVVLDITVTNKGKKQTTLDESDFKLIQKDKEYSPSSTIAFEENESLWLESLNPDSTIKGKIAYDVTEEVANSKDLKVKIAKDMFSSEYAYVTLKKK